MLEVENPECISAVRQFAESYPQCAHHYKKHYKIRSRWMFTGLIHHTILLLWQINPLISAVLRDIAGFLSAQFSSRKEEPGNCATWVCCRFEFDLNYLLISQSWLPRHWTISMASHEGVSCFQLRPTDTDRCTVGQISKNSSWWDVGMPISFQIQWITTWKKVLLYSRYKVFWLQKTSSKDFVLKKSCFFLYFQLQGSDDSFISKDYY